MMALYSNMDFSSLPLERLFINMKSSSSAVDRMNLTADLKASMSPMQAAYISVWDATDN